VNGGARVEVVGLSAAYGRTRVLESVRLTVEPGGWLAIIGPNGSGKSTLLRSILGFHPHEGLVRLDGLPTTGMHRRDRARCLAYAPQTPVLPDGVTTRDYVTLGRTPHRPLLSAPRAVDRQIVADVMDRLGLGPMAERTLATLSGGEQQRAVLARALAQQPRVLLLDEPTAGMGIEDIDRVVDLVRRIAPGRTIVLVEHNLRVVADLCDRVTVMTRGKVLVEGTYDEVRNDVRVQTAYLGGGTH
jgi:iron complex transport system ATP-binding protein